MEENMTYRKGSTQYIDATLKEGENIIICDVGAYGRVLGSNYNLRTMSREILIKNSKVFEIRQKEKLEKII